MGYIPTAFGDVHLDEAYYHCAACGVDTIGPDGTGRSQKGRPVCGSCGGATTFNGVIMPEPMASQGWTSRAIATYFRGAPVNPPGTQRELIPR